MKICIPLGRLLATKKKKKIKNQWVKRQTINKYVIKAIILKTSHRNKHKLLTIYYKALPCSSRQEMDY